MEPEHFGTEAMTEEVWGGDGNCALPIYKVTLSSVLRGILPFGKRYVFRQATERAVDSHADLRWGPDRRGFRRLLHPNGVCLIGLWEITEETAYSGYFRKGSHALVVGRYSTCCTETRRGYTRSLALVGKLFPTTDANHARPFRTASFITQQDIAGEHTDYINDAELRNAPDVHAWRRGMGVPILLTTGALFQHVDKEPSHRQLYQIAELGKPNGEPTRSPEFMRLLVASNWRSIGRLTFDNAVVSYNSDFVIHFNHPTWRNDRNDPSTATRVNGHKKP